MYLYASHNIHLLEQFDTNISDLYICIKLDHIYGGSFCIKDAFDLCFHDVKESKNAIDASDNERDNQKNPLLYAFDSGDGYQPALLGSFWGFDGLGNQQVHEEVEMISTHSSIHPSIHLYICMLCICKLADCYFYHISLTHSLTHSYIHTYMPG